MTALMFHGRRDIRFETIPIPDPKPGEVLIKVTDAGLSQTQVSEFSEGPFIINNEPHPRSGVSVPLIPCQEFGGTIVKLGDGVDESLLGNMVAALPLVPCEECVQCTNGHENLCETLIYLGLVGGHGGFCGYSALSVKNVFEVPSSRRDTLSFIEPLLIGIHTIKRMRNAIPSPRVVVIGAGAVGVAIAVAWQKLTDAQVIVYDRLKERVERCRELGINAASSYDALASKYDIVIDAAGKEPMADVQATEFVYDLCQPKGTVMLLATYFSPVSHNVMGQLVQEIQTLPSFAYDYDDVETLKKNFHLIDCSFAPLIKRLRLDELVERGYYLAELDKSQFTRFVCSEDG